MTVTPFRTSPAYEAHLGAGAAFHINSGWRRVDYFADNQSPEHEALRPAGYEGAAWSSAVVSEHVAVRTTAGLFDFSTFGKIEVAGPGASSLLEWVCSNRVSRGPGRITYTQMLNESGGVIGDFTVSQLGPERFVAITNTGALAHDLEWISAQAQNPSSPIDGPVTITDVTNGWACFGLWGPLARDILQPMVDTSLATADFPYMQFRDASIGGVAVRLARVTFVGELGWEIYVPTGYGRWLWQELSEAVSAAGGRRGAFMCANCSSASPCRSRISCSAGAKPSQVRASQRPSRAAAFRTHLGVLSALRIYPPIYPVDHALPSRSTESPWRGSFLLSRCTTRPVSISGGEGEGMCGH
ncbi:MAG: aminomethyltransferase family protein [Actinobacteria bacterium]|nr:aminomethyltransferase family protein [Actinomycetota bacterium]